MVVTDRFHCMPICVNCYLPGLMAAISQTTHSSLFPWMKFLFFYSNFTDICSEGCNWQWGSICSGNGLAPNRRQAITWTDVDPVYWLIYAAPGETSLTHWGRDEIDAILQTTVSNAFSWVKMFDFLLTFHWSLFLKVRLTISQHWFR